MLTVIKRQGEGSPIVEAAHSINHGQQPVARSTAAGDLYVVRAKPAKEDDGAHAQRLVVESAVRLGAQVLSPQHTSSVGVSALNRALQARLNPPQPGKPEVQVSADVTFRLGDKLIAGKIPAWSLGQDHNGTVVGALVNLVLVLALMFWPGGDNENPTFGHTPQLPDRTSPRSGAGPVAADRIARATGTNFGRRAF